VPVRERESAFVGKKTGTGFWLSCLKNWTLCKNRIRPISTKSVIVKTPF
jgi:hypothetical protein